jgi:hypothetical protein
LRTIPGFIQSAQKSSSRTDCSKSTGSTGAGAGRANRTRSSMPLVLGPQSVRTPYDADGGPAEPRSNAKRFGPARPSHLGARDATAATRRLPPQPG